MSADERVGWEAVRGMVQCTGGGLLGWAVKINGREVYSSTDHEDCEAVTRIFRDALDEALAAHLASRRDEGAGERERVQEALILARLTTNSLYSDVRDLLNKFAKPCPEANCPHANCSVLRALGRIIEDRRTEIVNAALTARRADSDSGAGEPGDARAEARQVISRAIALAYAPTFYPPDGFVRALEDEIAAALSQGAGERAGVEALAAPPAGYERCPQCGTPNRVTAGMDCECRSWTCISFKYPPAGRRGSTA